jgi:glucose uptake protein
MAWGIWLVPAQRIQPRNQLIEVFYVTAGNLVVATGVGFMMGSSPLPGKQFGLIFMGGAVWTLSGFCAFGATARLGIARAAGLWSPLNIIVSLAWGALLFGEFTRATPSQLGITGLAIAGLVAGLLIIITAEKSANPVSDRTGWWLALGAGILWGSYFLPIRISGASPWSAAFPMSLGMFGTAALIALVLKVPLRSVGMRGSLLQTLCGVLWAVGNYGSLLMMERWGTGRGFAMAQLSLVINGLVGIYFFRSPTPGTSPARRVLIGCAIATVSGICLGTAF